MAWGKKKPRGTRVVDRFAAALAETGDVRLASAAIGIKPSYGTALFALIRRELGVEQCR